MTPSRINAIIIDDEAHCRSALKKQLEWSAPHVQVIGEYENATAGEEAIRALKPDLVFLDIEMPDKNGFDLLKSFDDIFFEVIFTTAYDSFAIEAFRINATDYLLKPIDEEQLVEAVDKVAIHLRNRNPDQYLKEIMLKINENSDARKIPFPTSEGISFVALGDIIRCEAEGSYSYVYFGTGQRIFIAKTLKSIEELCDSEMLVRVHHSHLINIQRVQQYSKAGGGTILLDDGSTVPLARSKKDTWKKMLG